MTSTRTSPICAIKPSLSTSTSIQSLTSNGYEFKPSRVYVKKPFSTTNFLPNNSASHQQWKKRPILFLSRTTSTEQQNDINRLTKANVHQAILPPSSPPLIFLPVPRTPTKETNGLKQHVHQFEQQTNKDSIGTTSNGHDHSVNDTSKLRQSSCSDGENQSISSHLRLSIDDNDADESDNEQKHNLTKSRRLQKTRKTTNHQYPTPPLPRNHLRIDEHRRSSSFEDEESQESISRLNETHFVNRRLKISATKRAQHCTGIITTTTTTDDELTKQSHHQQQSVEPSNSKTTNESNVSSPNPTMIASATAPAPVRKINRFQVKSIRKSQQPQILLANVTAVKSSNDDDCSVPNEQSNSQARPTIIERSSINTPTTDGETSRINEHHHVRFQVKSIGKQDLNIEEDKSSTSSTNPTATVATTAPPAPSTATPAQGEDDEEEETVGNSPDGRFIKYAKEIGRGAFKTVYRGLDTETSVAVAWCELQDFAQFDKHERARFKEEAEMLKKLQHQNIVRFYDFWEETNPRTNKKVIILVTELMTSGSLKGYIRKFKGQKEEKRINVMKKWCRQILKGLAYLHGRNPPVIHRDLKCDNVFVSSTTGCVKIGDLGLATFKTQTFAKSMRGTMEFMAPEMFEEKYDELVDIYSFGLCMLEMITGEYPYIECKGPTAVIKRVTAGLKPDCYYKLENEDVREVIDCCIRTRKEERLPVHELLQHSFFLEENGLRIDLVRDTTNDIETMMTNEVIDFKLKIVDKTKRKALWTEHEAIRFRYHLKSDTPEQIADELIEKKYIFDDDKKFVIQSIKDRLRALHYEQIDRRAGVFSRDEKPILQQTSQTSLIGQPVVQAQILTPQQPATPLFVQQTLAPIFPVTPTPSLIQPLTSDLQPTPQQQSIVSMKSATEIPQAKPIISTESGAITPLAELSTSVSGPAGSLEVLDAALKKTFNKNISTQGLNPTSATINDSSETTTPLINQDDPLVLKAAPNLPVTTSALSDQQLSEENGEGSNSDLINNQSQLQPTTMIISQPSKSSASLSQTSSYSTGPTSQPFLSPALLNDSLKQLLPSSSSSSTAATGTETVENNPLSLILSHTNEVITSSILSDIPSTTPSQISGSLKQLDVLLTHTFKNSGKTTGTAHNSDTETTTTSIPLVPHPSNEDYSTKIIDIESDDNTQKFLDLFNHSSISGSITTHSQPTTSSLILPASIQQTKSQPTSSQMPTHFDPFISPERNADQLDALLKTPHERSSCNDDTIIAASSNDLLDIKSMIMDLSRTLLHKMTIIEQKIDEHHHQTQKIHHLLTETVLPSIIDLTDIIHETSTNLDPRVRTKLETIRTNVRSVRQQQPEIKDLMEI